MKHETTEQVTSSFLGHLDEGDSIGACTDCKPRATNAILVVKKGYCGDVVSGGNSLWQMERFQVVRQLSGTE